MATKVEFLNVKLCVITWDFPVCFVLLFFGLTASILSVKSNKSDTKADEPMSGNDHSIDQRKPQNYHRLFF